MKSLIGLTLALTSISATPRAVWALDVAQNVELVDPLAVAPPAGQLPTALLGLTSTTRAFSSYAFLVDKKLRTLTVWQNEADALKLVGSWPTDIGQQGGDKLVQGDRRTPEGIYFFQTSQDGRRVNFDQYGARIFTLDYPNYFDRLLNKSGNGIWFHAIPDTKSLLRGSRGCVVVRNQTIDALAKYIELKRTPMLIVDHVEYTDPPAWRLKRAELGAWLESWRQAWIGKDLDAYMNLYSEKFRSVGMDKKKWRDYKLALAKRYSFIDVALEDVQIFNQGPTVVFRFLQNYKSDAKTDYGTKTIYASRAGEAYEIVGESWAPFQPNTISSTAE